MKNCTDLPLILVEHFIYANYYAGNLENTNMTVTVKITISIVSHGQASLVGLLLADLAAQTSQDFDVILTINVPEDESFDQGYPFQLRIIRNESPKGFGANHNAAFNIAVSKWFTVVNPDIRLGTLDVELLLSPFSDNAVAAVAPLVLSREGNVEDSMRRFPTLWRFAKRLILGQRVSDYIVGARPFQVDWVAGMFVIFRRDAFRQIKGFDDRRFFMYLEDADICRRLGRSGWKVVVTPLVQVIHVAQRASRRNAKHMRWHAVSAIRYLTGL